MSLKITTLIENLPDAGENLQFEHGFSVFIEAEGKRILFDTGQSGAFVKNAKMLGIDLSTVDMLVLSHGHYDHTGGVPEFLSVCKKKLPVYVGKEFFSPKYKLLEDGTWKYNGNPFENSLLSTKNVVHFVEEDVILLSESLYLFKNFARVNDFETVNPKFFIKRKMVLSRTYFRMKLPWG